MHTRFFRFADAADRAAVAGFVAGVALTSLLWIAVEVLLGGAA